VSAFGERFPVFTQLRHYGEAWGGLSSPANNQLYSWNNFDSIIKKQNKRAHTLTQTSDHANSVLQKQAFIIYANNVTQISMWDSSESQFHSEMKMT